MKNEEKYISLAQAKRLKELGVTVVSENWDMGDFGNKLRQHDIPELMQMLPDEFTDGGVTYELLITKIGEDTSVSYCDIHNKAQDRLSFEDKIFAWALADILISGIEANLPGFTPDEINARGL